MLLLSWVSLGFFTGLIANQVLSNSAGAVTNISIAVIGAVGGGWLLGQAAGNILPDWTLFTSILPAIVGAAIALYAYQRLSNRSRV